VFLLAKTIVKHAKTTHALPSAIQLSVGDRPVVTAPMAFEILSRTLALRQKSSTFPQTVPGLLLSLKPYDPAKEPPVEQRELITIWTPHFLDPQVPKTLEFAYQMQSTLPIKLTLKDKSKLSAAEYVVAMAMMVKEWGDTGTISEFIGISSVTAPKVWDDQSNPVPLVMPVMLRVTVNGVNVQRSADGVTIPDAVRQPFCGAIQIACLSSGPVVSLTMDLDGERLCAFEGAGAYGYTIDSLRLADGEHQLTVTLTDDDGKSLSSTLPLQVQNGRISSFTPAEIETPEVTNEVNG
jgi:hypothetical protein